MTRTERQQESVKRWLANKGKGTIVAATGFGKSRCGLMTIKALLKKYPQFRILVVVPTEALQKQWLGHIDEWGFQFNVEVVIINTCIKHTWQCDMLIIDEIHRTGAEEFSKVFEQVKYRIILGLTATIERLDGKHLLIQKYCPVVDDISTIECLANGWISEYKEYQVLLDVDNIDYYKSLNKEWIEHFEFFQYDFGLAMSMVNKDGWKNKIKFRDTLYKGDDENMKKQVLQSINYHSARFIATMTARKAFIYSHPKKIEIARKILEARSGSKIITFSNSVEMAEAIENGQNVYTGKTSKKKGRVMLEDFISGNIKTLHSCKKLDEGFDCPDASVAIILGFDSSETKSTQRRGRVVRKFEDKVAEIFYLVINNTQETKWFSTAHSKTNNYITIDEIGLEKVLRGELPQTTVQKPRELMFRF
jgi:superfamily II DNA or RNA helicase